MRLKKKTLLTILTAGVVLTGTLLAIMVAKGYRLSPGSETTIIAGTGILSINSVPDQASVYLDGHLTSATNTNINSLKPKTYDVRIVKEGFIPWEKKVEVSEGRVSEIKATLYRSLPTIYPLTYSGVSNVTISPNREHVAYVVPGSDKKSGIWVWTMSERPINFARSSEPHQIYQNLTNLELNKSTLRWSPDSAQLLVSLPNQNLLLEQNRLNDTPRDITPILETTIKGWEDDQKAKEAAKLLTIKDLNLRNTASASAVLSFSPDEEKVLYSKDGKSGFKVVTLAEAEVKTYDMPEGGMYSWLPDSEHLLVVESEATKASPSPSASPVEKTPISALSKISVIEFDGFNKFELYAGNFDPASVFVWPNGSRLVIVSSFGTASASAPNLFGINLK